MRCSGWTEEEIHDWYLEQIQTHGWAVVAVAAQGRHAGFAYTIGLTRFHGHPELLVSGLDHHDTHGLLDDFGAQVRQGTRFAWGDVIPSFGRHRFQLVRVDDPGQIAEAQGVYASEIGLVPALQLVYSDHDGRWPWDRRWPDGRFTQPVFGKPLHR